MIKKWLTTKKQYFTKKRGPFSFKVGIIFGALFLLGYTLYRFVINSAEAFLFSELFFGTLIAFFIGASASYFGIKRWIDPTFTATDVMEIMSVTVIIIALIAILAK